MNTSEKKYVEILSGTDKMGMAKPTKNVYKMHNKANAGKNTTWQSAGVDLWHLATLECPGLNLS